MKPDQDNLDFLISQLIDGDLGEAERNALDERLADDRELRATRNDFDRLDRALKALPSVPESQWGRFEAQVMDQCRGVHRNRVRQQWVRWGGGLLAAAAAVAFVSTLMLQTWAPTGSKYVAEVSVGPKPEAPAPRTQMAGVTFSFARGGRSLPEPVVKEAAPPSGGTLIVACASPMVGNGTGWGELAF